jgi:hypothetical protein
MKNKILDILREAATPSGKITRAELVAMFGDAIPIEAAELLWECPPDWTTDRLRSELRALASPALREAAAPSEEPVGYLFEFCYSHEHDWWSDPLYSGRLPKAEDVRNVRPLFASPAVAPVAVSVEVKLLEWFETPLSGGMRFEGVAPVGRNYVIQALWHGQYGKLWWTDADDCSFPSLDAAKAAAQADFNARILSSIVNLGATR